MKSSSPWPRRLFRGGLLILFAAALAGCGDTIKGKSIAEPEVAVFHRRFNAKEYDDIHSLAHADFRAAAPKEKLSELLDAIHRKLGAMKSTTQQNWSVKTFNTATHVVFVHETQFEHGSGTETFTFRVDGGKATLVGYHINSLDMLTK